jgi:ATP-binding cassette subfamily B protein
MGVGVLSRLLGSRGLRGRRPGPGAGPDDKAATNSLARIRRLHQATQFAMPHRYMIGVILLLTLGIAAMNAVEPLIFKYVFDGLTESTEPAVMQALFIGLPALAVFAVAREAASATSNWLTWRTRIGVHYALLEATVGKLHRMPLRMQRSEGVGALMTRLDRSIHGFVEAITQLLFQVLPSLVYLIMATVIMFQLDWRLALVVLAFAPIPALIAAHAAPVQTRRDRTLLERWARIYARFNEVLSGILVVRSFAMEEFEKRRFLEDVSQANRVVIQGVAVDAGYGASSNFVVATARLAAIGVGAWLVLAGEATIGTLVAFLGYVGGLFGPVQGLSGIYQTVARASVSVDEIFRILNVQEDLAEAPDAIDLAELTGAVEFDGVGFGYETSTRPLLENVSFRAEPKQTVAIVGPSGSGKTTLMALLMRFYDPQHGALRVDGRDVKTIKQTALRRHMAVVLQDPLLFNDTVRSNIAYAKPDATQEEIEAAAKAANAHDFIMRLPEGYRTQVGERGGLLSMGERQRITIARALLKDPAILILDEATSALDLEAERSVQDALEKLQQRCTTFVIAHRLQTVVDADRIVVLKDGHVAEQGTHAELLARDGYYASLVKRQRRGTISNDAPSAPPDHAGQAAEAPG